APPWAGAPGLRAARGPLPRPCPATRGARDVRAPCPTLAVAGVCGYIAVMTTAAERQSREVAEAAREREWKGASFMRDLFLGRFRLDLVHPYPVEEPDRPAFRDFYAGMRRLLEEKVDPVAIDETGE